MIIKPGMGLFTSDLKTKGTKMFNIGATAALDKAKASITRLNSDALKRKSGTVGGFSS